MPSVDDSIPNMTTSFSRQPAAHANDVSDSEASMPTTPGSDRRHSAIRRSSSASSLSFDLDLGSPTLFTPRKEDVRIPKGNTASQVTQKSQSLIRKAYLGYYSYTRIPPDQVRLLVIEPGAGDDPINVTLLVVADELLGTKKWPYIALSYHWGQGEEVKEIFVQDDPTSRASQPLKGWSDVVAGAQMLSGSKGKKKKLIRPNLYEALRHLRHETTPRPTWIDALCIDQGNKPEKSEQVCKMATIYRKARSVCIWLGYDEDGNPSSAMAMKFIPQVINPDKYQKLLDDETKIAHWASLFELLKWSWFSRRWIIQELALAKDATVHCGDNPPIHWKDFQDAIAIFCANFEALKPRLRSYLEQTSRYNRNRWNNDSDFEIEQLGAKLLVEISFNLFRKNHDGSSESTYSLEMLVCLLSSFDASDSRDTINALINISSEMDNPPTNAIHPLPVPDYSKDLFEVYRDFVKYVVATSDSLDIICRHWALPDVEPDASRLPSWIQFADDSAFGRGYGVFEGRKAGGSLVGLPDRSQYHASRRGHLRKLSRVRWPEEPARVVHDERSEENGLDQPQLRRCHNPSMVVTGLAIGTISFRTDPFPDSIIPRSCLKGLGWSFRTSDVPEQLYQTLVADRGPNGTPMPILYRRACQHVMVNLTRNHHINIDSLLRQETGYIKNYLERVRAVTWNRLFIEACPLTSGANEPLTDCTKKLVGLGPPKTEKDDVIAILYGCSVPVILRPTYDVDGKIEGHQFVGEAFVYGKMDGEALRGGYEETEFCLI